MIMMNNPMNSMNNNKFTQNNMMNMPNFPLDNNLMNGPNFQMCNLMNFNNNIPPMTQNWNYLNNKEVKGLTIIFRISGEQYSPVSIQCLSDDKMEDTINKFCNKVGGNKKDYKFIFNAHQLMINSTVEENELGHNSNIFVVRQNEISKKLEENNNNNHNIIKNNSMSEREIHLSFETKFGIDSKVVIKFKLGLIKQLKKLNINTAKC